VKPSYLNYQQQKWENAKAHSQAVTPQHFELGAVTETEFRPQLPPPQRYGASDGRAQLKKLGVSDVHATLAMTYLWYLPRTSDADSQGVQIIISAIQKGLNVKQTGYLTGATIARLEQVSGKGWFDKNWNSLLGDVLTHKPEAVGNYVEVGDIGISCFPLLFWATAGVAAYFYFKGKKGK